MAKTCTTHHNACDCREAHFATIALEREHWFSLANQRALDLAAERESVRGLEAVAKFARHKDGCGRGGNSCTCGLDTARKALGEG